MSSANHDFRSIQYQRSSSAGVCGREPELLTLEGLTGEFEGLDNARRKTLTTSSNSINAPRSC